MTRTWHASLRSPRHHRGRIVAEVPGVNRVVTTSRLSRPATNRVGVEELRAYQAPSPGPAARHGGASVRGRPSPRRVARRRRPWVVSWGARNPSSSGPDGASGHRGVLRTDAGLRVGGALAGIDEAPCWSRGAATPPCGVERDRPTSLRSSSPAISTNRPGRGVGDAAAAPRAVVGRRRSHRAGLERPGITRRWCLPRATPAWCPRCRRSNRRQRRRRLWCCGPNGACGSGSPPASAPPES